MTSYAYDPVSRLPSLTQEVGGTASDLSLGFAYNPASQISSNTRSNDAYSFTGHASGTVGATVNGLNQLVQQGGAALSYDARGNLISDGTRSYGFTSENRLASGPGTQVAHDPLGRLFYVGSTGTVFDHDGASVVTELDAATGRQVRRRYVHGPGVDEPLVWYEGPGTNDRRYLHADERGSIVAVSDNAGNAIGINKYDEYGVPVSTNIGRFQYTGQKWLSELGLYDYKARMYDPKLGRFLQTDPIGYGDGMNLYGYVGGDPVNYTDPSGLNQCTQRNPDCPPPVNPPESDIVVYGRRIPIALPAPQSDPLRVSQPAQLLPYAGPSLGGNPAECGNAACTEVIVTARRRPRGILTRLGDLLRPPEDRRPDEAYGECVQRLSGVAPATIISGLAGVAVGGPWLGYPRAGFGGGGNGTSLISYFARASFGPERMKRGALGTGSQGGAIGRGVSRVSTVGGAAIAGFGIGVFIGALDVCRN